MHALTLTILDQAPSREILIGQIAILVLAIYGLRRFFTWLLSPSTQPNPWDPEVEASLKTEHCQPLCHECLEPHDPLLHFCPNCGATVGLYTNWMPYLPVFSVG